VSVTDLDLGILTGVRPAPAPSFLVDQAQTRADLDAYRALRREVFVAEQGMFSADDADRMDEDPRTVVLLARASDGTVLGGSASRPRSRDATSAGGRAAVSS
jgi:hypothetical protein